MAMMSEIFLLGYSSKSNGGSWPKRPRLQKLSLAWDGIKLSDPSLASSLPLHRTSEVFRSDNTSYLIPAWSRVPGYHADPLKSEAMPHSTRPQKPVRSMHCGLI